MRYLFRRLLARAAQPPPFTESRACPSISTWSLSEHSRPILLLLYNCAHAAIYALPPQLGATVVQLMGLIP